MEIEKPSYYAVIPANVRYDKRLKANEKLMYGEIVCLSNKNGFCHASNNYFSELYEVTPQAISGWIKNLEKCGYITCEYLHNGLEIKERQIRIIANTNSTNDEMGNSRKVEKGVNKTLKGYKQNFKENNTSNNNINENNTSGVPAYVQQPIKTDKESFQNFLNDCFLLITNHNKTAKHKIPISKAIMYFTQKEGRELLELSRQYEISEIKSALENYLKVANSETWKSGFSFNAFCKNIAEYIPEYFDMSKYINAPKSKEDIQAITDAFAEKNKKEKWFDYAILHHHREDWIKAGKPEGKEFEKWADKVYDEDTKNGIKY